MVGEVSKTCELFVCTYPLVIQQFAMENDPFIDGLPIKKRLAYISPHLCVGFLFLILYPAAASASSTQLCHTQLCHTHTHTIFQHKLSHTTLSHTQLTTLSLTLFHTQLCHTPSFNTNDPCFAWQARHFWHWAGSGGALGPRWSPVTPQHFAWQA